MAEDKNVIGILFGVKGGGDINGASGVRIRKELSAIAKKLSLSVDVKIDASSIKKINEQIQKELKSIIAPTIKVKIDTEKAVRGGASGKTTQKGVGTTGGKDAASETKEVSRALDDYSKAARELFKYLPQQGKEFEFLKKEFETAQRALEALVKKSPGLKERVEGLNASLAKISERYAARREERIGTDANMQSLDYKGRLASIKKYETNALKLAKKAGAGGEVEKFLRNRTEISYLDAAGASDGDKRLQQELEKAKARVREAQLETEAEQADQKKLEGERLLAVEAEKVEKVFQSQLDAEEKLANVLYGNTEKYRKLKAEAEEYGKEAEGLKEKNPELYEDYQRRIKEARESGKATRAEIGLSANAEDNLDPKTQGYKDYVALLDKWIDLEKQLAKQADLNSEKTRSLKSEINETVKEIKVQAGLITRGAHGKLTETDSSKKQLTDLYAKYETRARGIRQDEVETKIKGWIQAEKELAKVTDTSSKKYEELQGKAKDAAEAAKTAVKNAGLNIGGKNVDPRYDEAVQQAKKIREEGEESRFTNLLKQRLELEKTLAKQTDLNSREAQSLKKRLEEVTRQIAEQSKLQFNEENGRFNKPRSGTDVQKKYYGLASANDEEISVIRTEGEELRKANEVTKKLREWVEAARKFAQATASGVGDLKGLEKAAKNAKVEVEGLIGEGNLDAHTEYQSVKDKIADMQSSADVKASAKADGNLQMRWERAVAGASGLNERYVDLIKNSREAREAIDALYAEINKGRMKIDDPIKNKNGEVIGKVTIADVTQQTQQLELLYKKTAATMSTLEAKSHTLGNKIKETFNSKVLQSFAYALVGLLTGALRKVYTNVAELDSAITDLQIATGKTREETTKLVKSYADLAKQLGATMTEVTEGADTWLRQGYDVAETTQLISDSMMLSKLGQLESAEASKALTSAMKGYKVEVEDALNIVDKFTAVDMAAATSAGDIATAMAETAASANVAGVSMDRLIGYISTVAEVTQDGAESVGNFYKTLFARMGNVKTGRFIDGETGERLNDVEGTLSTLGIELRSSNDTFRDFGEVLDEVGAKWNSYTNVQQHAIATAFAGKLVPVRTEMCA